MFVENSFLNTDGTDATNDTMPMNDYDMTTGEFTFEMRIGIHTGPVLQGSLGLRNSITTFGVTP